jgi:Nucleotidyltransferase domain
MPLIELPAPETAYIQILTARLQHVLDAQLIGVYLFGSAAYGAYEPGRSDLDVQAVVSQPLTESEYRALTARIANAALPCPARKLEFVLYTQQAAGTATRHPQFALNFNTGAGQPDHLVLDPAQEAGHWFLLDIALGRKLGRALTGPPPAELFAAPQQVWVLDALLESLRWHHAHEVASANSLANACRGWRWAETGVWGSKQGGVAWAAGQPNAPQILREVEQARQTGESLQVGAAEAVLALVEQRVRLALEDAEYARSGEVKDPEHSDML